MIDRIRGNSDRRCAAPKGRAITLAGGAHFTTPRRLVAGLLFLIGCQPQTNSATPTPAAAPGPPPQTAPRVEPSPKIADGAALIAAMHDRYPSWYRTMTFVQTTTIYRANGELVQTWYEMGALPGRLRIDTDLANKSGQLFAHDSVYGVVNGTVMRATAGLNELLVLGFDVYTQPPTRTADQLRKQGFDLTKLHEDTLNGKRVFVVGATSRDTTTKQFWVDADNLLFVRSVGSGTRGRTDVRFERYERAKGGWIATEVLQLVNGRPSLREQYANVHVDVPIDDAYFDPKQWSTVRPGMLFGKP
jgi:hypothetical protein